MRANEKRLYKQVIAKIYADRDAECEECGRYLAECRWHNFHHEKGRNTITKLCDEKHIRLLCFACHHKIHNKNNITNAEWLDT